MLNWMTRIVVPATHLPPDDVGDDPQVFQSHVKEEHVGEAIPEVREFDWVVLRVGKLHLAMNALKAFVDLNWDVWFAALAEEMDFKSEGAQRVAKSCVDHHKSMQLLQIAIKGSICKRKAEDRRAAVIVSR
ncbi:Hypp6864 [Branchiostoma lanceolatum]|uniref:Hypp6864 protein n=1 Tax=Branchiostoma lanceolatum TaxID=7740 RepID=A0A8J9YVS5_BRALA|nr:Hypp6864 [Branchiostoma lanceolatum]